MAGKSETKHILLDMAGPDVVSKFSKKIPARIVLMDGLIFLYKKGNDLCNLRILKGQPCASGSIFDDDDAFHPGNTSNQTFRRENGTWGDLGRAFERMLKDAFAIRETEQVILGFDKREFISRAKDLVQRKRREKFAIERQRQIEKDTARGVAHTQGIPFTLEELTPDGPLPYPWAVVASDKKLLSIVVQYILVHHLIPNLAGLVRRPTQTLLIDGHGLASMPSSLKQKYSIKEETSNHTPLLVSIKDGHVHRELAMQFRNTVGECDHVLFHYIHQYTSQETEEETQTFRILTTDTDLLLLAVCMVERRHAQNRTPIIDLQVPTKVKDRNTFEIVHVNRLVDQIARKHPIAPRPVQNIAFAMYLKSHDYDAVEDYERPFFHRIGHKKIVDAYIQYASHIGPLVQWRDQSRLEVCGEAIKKVVCLAYFYHYDQLKGKQTRIYPQNTSILSITIDDLRRRVAEKNIGRKKDMQMLVPNDDDIIIKALRMQFLATLCDDAVHGRASTETRSISDKRLEEFGYACK